MAHTEINGATQIRDATIPSIKVDPTIIIAPGTNPFSGNQSFAGFRATDLGTPTDPGDATNKEYVDALAGGALGISDIPYDPTSWNGVTNIAPSKNAVRDYLVTLANGAFTNLTTVGNSFATLPNPNAIRFPRINAGNGVDPLDAATFRTAIGAGTSSFSGAFGDLTGKPTTLLGYGITDAQPLDADLTNIAGLIITGNPLKFLRVNTAGTAYELATVIIGDAFQDLPLSQFADTTSAQLAGVMTDETGTGLLVFGTGPVLNQPLINGPIGITYGDIGGFVPAQMSIEADEAGVKLIGDLPDPGLTKYYGTNFEGTLGYYDLPVSAIEGEWLFSTNTDTTVNPGTGKFRTNEILFNTSTEMSIASISSLGVDRTNILKMLRTNDLVLIQDKSNAANWVRYRITVDPTSHTDWYLIPVEMVEGGGTLPTNNSPTVFAFTATGTSGGGTSYTDEQAQDAAVSLFASGTHIGIDYTYDDTGNKLNSIVTGAPWSGIVGKPTTLAGYGITDAQPLDADLTNIASLTLAGNAGKAIKVNAGATAYELGDVAGGAGSVVSTELIVLEHQEAQNVQGGDFVTGADRTAKLNVEVFDEGNHCTLSGDQFTLDAGTYRMRAWTQAFAVNQWRSWLYNVTDGTVVLLGSSEYTPVGADIQKSNIEGTFTISLPKTFEIRKRCALTKTINGVGTLTNFTGVEVYTRVFLEKQGTPFASGPTGPQGIQGIPGPAGLNGELVAADVISSVKGFHLEYLSPTTVEVFPGKARDSTDVTVLTTTSRLIIDHAVNGAILGNDSFLGPGTISYVTATGVVTGVGTSFLSAFGKRALTGTITSVTTAVTGIGTRFLDEVSIGDLIGTDAKSYRFVSAIASNTALTLGSAPTTAFAGEIPNCVEQPSLKIGPNLANTVVVIASDTSITCNTGGAAQSAVSYRIGVQYALSNNATFVFAVRGTSGTSVITSTQRTKPYSMAFGGSPGITGYNQYYRRIGSYMINVDEIIPFSQWGENELRYLHHEVQVAQNGTRILSAGASAVWAGVSCHAMAPATAKAIIVAGYTVTAATIVAFRKRNTGSTVVTRPLRFVIPTASSTGTPAIIVPCDGAQYFDYNSSAATADVYLEGVGYMEWL